MSLTYRIRPGDSLDADEVEQNFDDLATLVNNAVGASQVETGAVHTRHCTTAADWKSLESKTAASTALSGTPATVIPSSASDYTTFSTQAYLVRATVRATVTGAAPVAILRIKIGGSTVIQRTHYLVASGIQLLKIAWLAVASANTTTVELEGEGADCTLSSGAMTVLAVSR
jgi:hypothetical protein